MWMEARYSGFCVGKDCYNEIKVGDQMYMFNGQVYCKECGKEIEETDADV